MTRFEMKDPTVLALQWFPDTKVPKNPAYSCLKNSIMTADGDFSWELEPGDWIVIHGGQMTVMEDVEFKRMVK